MELISMSGSVPCSEARELLSDLIDVRRGELPHPDGTRLAEPGMRAALELHLAGCTECQAELKALEEVDSVFSDFSVSELPAQHFANYGQRVRERMTGKKVVSFPQRRTNFWFKAAASMAAAACLAFVAGRAMFDNKPDTRTGPLTRVTTEDGKRLPIFETPMSLSRLSIQRPMNGMLQPVDLALTPTEPTSPSDRLKANEGQYGYLIFGERTPRDARPLLGVTLKTTRDVDRVRDEMPVGLMVWSVEQGSPAQMMGLRRGDFIVQANDLAINNGGAEEAATFLSAISNAKPGSMVELHIVRPVGDQFLYLKPKVGLLGMYE